MFDDTHTHTLSLSLTHTHTHTHTQSVQVNNQNKSVSSLESTLVSSPLLVNRPPDMMCFYSLSISKLCSLMDSLLDQVIKLHPPRHRHELTCIKASRGNVCWTLWAPVWSTHVPGTNQSETHTHCVLLIHVSVSCWSPRPVSWSSYERPWRSTLE